jgi:16S rRNA (cytosine1402-N4)-methyltransferase
MMSYPHISVLSHETTALFSRMKEGLFVDCTIGYGGHSETILRAFPAIRCIGIDRDKTAIEFSKNRLKEFGERVEFIHGSFGTIFQTLKKNDIAGTFADLGVSSPQLNSEDRGFSFSSCTLDMRMDRNAGISAEYIVNNYNVDEMAKIFAKYGEERESMKIANLIVCNRPFKTAKELACLIAKNIKRHKIHPATKIFQAIRIEVNHELEELKLLLDEAEKLQNGAIIGIISFHSLEDKMVKERFKEWARSCICPADAMRCLCGGDHALGRTLTKKPVVAEKKEIEGNPRSRSAKLRGFRFFERLK